MKKVFAAIVALMLVVSLMTSALAYSTIDDPCEGYVVITGGSVNTRTSPSLNGGKLRTMHRGDVAEYLDEYSVDNRGVIWYLIWWSGRECWVSSRYSELVYACY